MFLVKKSRLNKIFEEESRDYRLNRINVIDLSSMKLLFFGLCFFFGGNISTLFWSLHNVLLVLYFMKLFKNIFSEYTMYRHFVVMPLF